jgi:hypothetical protein
MPPFAERTLAFVSAVLLGAVLLVGLLAGAPLHMTVNNISGLEWQLSGGLCDIERTIMADHCR